MIAGYIPWRFLGVAEAQPSLGNPFHILGILAILAGLILLAACIWEFARSGRGTLAPVDPPRELVVRGLYRHVRNPMYLSVSTILLGEFLITGSRALLLYWAIFFALANLFVIGYEERALRARFGASYERYTREVNRWLPRLSHSKNS
jgi:protein-S-isoprenylcysteine O-methyltransferase Ste14